MTFNACPKCGCYLPIEFDTCPACGYTEKPIEEPKVEVEINYEEYKPDPDTAYQTLIKAIYGDKPIGFYPDYVSPNWDEKEYNRLKNAIFNYIQWDVSFLFWDRSDIHSVPAFGNIGHVAIDDMLFCLAEEGKIDRYSTGMGWENHYYRRLPQTKEEERNRKKYYSRKYKRFIFHY